MILQITNRELLYHRKNFYDNLRIHGTPCRIYSINNEYQAAYDFYSDIKDDNTSFDDSIESYLTYEEVPTIKTLKSLGWYVEGEELPVIGYVPVHYEDKNGDPATFSPSVDDKVEVRVNPYDKNSSVRQFLIKDFKGQGFPSVIYYTCKLVPFRKSGV